MSNHKDVVENVFTLHTSAIPFTEHNDGARMQMASSQIRQQIMYENPDIPLVMTGYEDYILDLYRYKFDESGTVKYVDRFNIVIDTDSGKRYNINVSQYDLPVVKVGDRVSKGTLLVVPEGFVKEYSIDDEKEYYFCYGKNLLTAILTSSYEYEDAYYISEEAAEKLKGYIKDTFEITLSPNEELIPLENGEYLRQKGSIVRRGEILASVRNKYTDKVQHYFESNDYIVEDVVVIINNDIQLINYDVRYRAALTKYVLEKIKYAEEFPIVANDYKLYAKNIANNDKTEWSVIVKYYLKQIVNPDLGNKITNRHAGKGVISKIEEVEKDGKEVKTTLGYCPEFNQNCDIYLSPMSIISRMNIGTFLEMLASKLSYFVKTKIEIMVNENKPIEEIKKFIRKFYEDFYSETGIYHDMMETVDKYLNKITSYERAMKFIPFIYAPPMNSPTLEKLIHLIEKYKIETIYFAKSFITTDMPIIFDMYSKKIIVNESNKEDVIKSLIKNFNLNEQQAEELISKEDIYELNPVLSIIRAKRDGNTFYFIAFISYLYYMALVHISENKLTSRSVGRLSRKYLTPERRDDRKDTGQRVGEMESLCLLSHGSESILYEFMTTYSDDIYKKTEFVFSELYGIEVPQSSGISESGTVHILNSYLKFLSGFEIKDITDLLVESTDEENLEEISSVIENEEGE